MALFEPRRSDESEDIVGPTPPTRALSVSVVETISVARVYENIAWLRSDLRSGAASGPRQRDSANGDQPGDRVLEVGVGTGINAALYPTDCS